MSLERKEKNKRLTWMLLGLWTGCLVVISFIRNSFGIELTDEAFYLAEVLSVEKGNVIYAFDNSNVSGMTLIPLLLLRLFRWFSPDLEGVFLFMRTGFLVFRLGILSASFFLLRKKFPPNVLFFSLSLMIPFWGERIPNFSYNTVSLYLLFLTASIRISENSELKGLKRLIKPFLCGIIIAFAELAHPAQILNVLWFGLTYLLFEKPVSWKKLFAYICGGTSIVVLLLLYIISQSGLSSLITGIHSLNAVGSTRIPFWQNLSSFLSTYRSVGFLLTVSWVLFAVYYIFKRKKLAFSQNCMNLSIAVGMLLCCTFILLRIETFSWMMILGGALGTAAFFCILSTSINKSSSRTWLCLLAYPFFMFLINGFLTSGGAAPRGIHFSICLFGIALCLLSTGHSFENWNRRICCLALTVVALIGVGADFLYVYREKPISEMNTLVTIGIYKGIFTTEDQAEQITKLENYLEDNTNPSQKLLFLDQASFGYLMTDCQVCAPSTWDRMQYHKHWNDPSLVYSYFENTNTVPDQIIYIDYGRDAMLSIDDPTYLFNDFVYQHYVLSEKREFGSIYSVQIFSLREENR